MLVDLQKTLDINGVNKPIKLTKPKILKSSNHLDLKGHVDRF